MVKILPSILLMLLVSFFPNPGLCDDAVSEEDALRLIDYTARALSKNAPHTIAQINKGVHPFKDKDHPELYVFVYDTNATGIAHFHNPFVGINFKGRGDVFGKKFHEEIVSGALEKGSGHVVYAFAMPGKKGRRYKKTFYQLTTGSDQKQYVVCSGIYLGLRLTPPDKE